jgi:hypothetical protein
LFLYKDLEKFAEILAKNFALTTRLQNGEVLVKLVAAERSFAFRILSLPTFLEPRFLSAEQIIEITKFMVSREISQILRTPLLERLTMDSHLIDVIKQLVEKDFEEALQSNPDLMKRLSKGELLVNLVSAKGWFSYPILCQPAFLESNCLNDREFIAISERLSGIEFAKLLKQTTFFHRLNSNILYRLISKYSEFEQELLKNETAINKLEAQEIVTLISEAYGESLTNLLRCQLITKKLTGDDLVQIVLQAGLFSEENIVITIAQTGELASKLNNDQVTQIALKNDNVAKTLLQKEQMISIPQYPNILRIWHRFPHSARQGYFYDARKKSRLRWLEVEHTAEEWFTFLEQRQYREVLQYILTDIHLLANLARDERVLEEVLTHLPWVSDIFNDALIKSLAQFNDKAFAEVVSSFQDFLIKHLTAQGLIKLAEANPEFIETILFNPQLLAKLTNDEQFLGVIQQISTEEVLIEVLSQENVREKISLSLWASLIKITKPYAFVSAIISCPPALEYIANSLIQDDLNLLLTNADLTLAIISIYPQEVTNVLTHDSNRHLGGMSIAIGGTEISLNKLLALRESYRTSCHQTFLELIQEALQKSSFEENWEEQQGEDEAAGNNTPNAPNETTPLIIPQQTHHLVKVLVENTPRRTVTTGKILVLVFLALISMALLATGIGAIAGSPLFVAVVSSLAWLAPMGQTTLAALVTGIIFTVVTTVVTGFTFKEKMKQVWSHGLSLLGIKSQEISESSPPNPDRRTQPQMLIANIQTATQFPNNNNGRKRSCCFWFTAPAQRAPENKTSVLTHQHLDVRKLVRQQSDSPPSRNSHLRVR